jgi:Raf kinase inhibitor-like YbhB/YbcL family protein
LRVTYTVVFFAALIIPALGLRSEAQQPSPPTVPGLTLTSTAFDDGAIIPPKYTQLVPNPISPALKWINVPENTVSFALIFHDPESVPKRSDDYLHWMVFNIPGSIRELPEGLPANPPLADGTIQAKNTHGDVGYRGPGAAAVGPYHHYTFELYALDIQLDLTSDVTRSDLLQAMSGHILAKAVLVGRFHR